MLPTGFTGSHTALQVLHWSIWLAWSWFCRWSKDRTQDWALHMGIFSFPQHCLLMRPSFPLHFGNIKKHLRKGCFGLFIPLGACFLAMSQCFICHVSVRHSSVILWPFGVIFTYIWISVYLSGSGKDMFGILMETELTICLTFDGIDILTTFIIIIQENVGISNFGVLVSLISVSLQGSLTS